MLKTDTKDELRQKRAVLDAKIKSVDNYTTKGEKRAQRAKKMALEGLIEIEEYKDILEQVEAEQEETRRKIEGVVVLTEAEFNRQFNKGRISPR